MAKSQLNRAWTINDDHLLYRLWVKGYKTPGEEGHYHAYKEITCYGTHPLLIGKGVGSPACGIEVTAVAGVVHVNEGTPPGEIDDDRCTACLRGILMMELAA